MLLATCALIRLGAALSFTDAVQGRVVFAVQGAAPALHPHEAQALRAWLTNKCKAAIAKTSVSDGAADRAVLLLQDVDHQLNEIMTQVNAEAQPDMGHQEQASRGALKHWLGVKRSMLQMQLARVSTASGETSVMGGGSDEAVGSLVEAVLMTESVPEGKDTWQISMMTLSRFSGRK